jgi:hypothetical protein
MILLAARPDVTLLMCDPWETLQVSEDYVKSQDFHTSLTKDQQTMYRQISKLKTEFAAHRREIAVKHSTDCAAEFEDEQFDLVFIDGDHSYSGCKTDIDAWWPLVKRGGWLSGHDYDHPKFPFGVKQAVDEWAENNGVLVELGENYTWFVRK